MTEAYLLDANILLRFFVQDDRKKATAVKKLVEKANRGEIALNVPFMAIVETVHTLRSFYRVAPSEISTQVTRFLNGRGIQLTAPPWIVHALDEFGRRNVSFGDACVAAEARSTAMAVASFDRDFDGLPGIVRFEPN